MQQIPKYSDVHRDEYTYMGQPQGRRRYRRGTGSSTRYFEWDSQEAEFEGYDRRGNHVGVFDEMTLDRVGPAIARRSINV